MAERIPIWLDCDPGHDDAFAIILAAEHPSLNLLGISTIHGNAPLDRVTENAMRILTAIGRTEIPVYAGCKKPFMRPSIHAPDIHGESGIDGTNLLPEPKVAYTPGNAIKAMYDGIMSTPFQTCILVATGTLTNVALLLATFPDVADHVKEISIMGGSFMEGNITKFAEFNIYADPESANAIFSNTSLSNRITLIPLDLTHQVLATPEVVQELLHPANIKFPEDSPFNTTPLRKMLEELLMFFASTYASVFNITEGPPLHDPLAVAALLPAIIPFERDDPISLPGGIRFMWEYAKVVVDIHGVTLGRTTKHVPSEGETVVRIGTGVDVPKFWEILFDAVGKADARGQVKWE
ncbi:Inosine/uridine-preferring nucleoside hydrolase domain-containing protein [Peziza echinospora]|nr:Inosine/uridine-preferring nucleoside hydrolase domain-containing protein [Peziza echinospora]